MHEAVTISALSRSTGVPSKTIRYWEELGLLPRATRSHTGYRLFSPDAGHYVEFIRKSKSIGLSLKEIRTVLELARGGRNPCPEVARFVKQKAEALGREIRALQALQARLKCVSREWSKRPVNRCFRGDELCCLIEDLPEANRVKGVRHNEKTVRAALCGPDGRRR